MLCFSQTNVLQTAEIDLSKNDNNELNLGEKSSNDYVDPQEYFKNPNIETIHDDTIVESKFVENLLYCHNNITYIKDRQNMFSVLLSTLYQVKFWEVLLKEIFYLIIGSLMVYFAVIKVQLTTKEYMDAGAYPRLSKNSDYHEDFMQLLFYSSIFFMIFILYYDSHLYETADKISTGLLKKFLRKIEDTSYFTFINHTDTILKETTMIISLFQNITKQFPSITKYIATLSVSIIFAILLANTLLLISIISIFSVFLVKGTFYKYNQTLMDTQEILVTELNRSINRIFADFAYGKIFLNSLKGVDSKIKVLQTNIEFLSVKIRARQFIQFVTEIFTFITVFLGLIWVYYTYVHPAGYIQRVPIFRASYNALATCVIPVKVLAKILIAMVGDTGAEIALVIQNTLALWLTSFCNYAPILFHRNLLRTHQYYKNLERAARHIKNFDIDMIKLFKKQSREYKKYYTKDGNPPRLLYDQSNTVQQEVYGFKLLCQIIIYCQQGCPKISRILHPEVYEIAYDITNNYNVRSLEDVKRERVLIQSTLHLFADTFKEIIISKDIEMNENTSFLQKGAKFLFQMIRPYMDPEKVLGTIDGAKEILKEDVFNNLLNKISLFDIVSIATNADSMDALQNWLMKKIYLIDYKNPAARVQKETELLNVFSAVMDRLLVIYQKNEYPVISSMIQEYLQKAGDKIHKKIGIEIEKKRRNKYFVGIAAAVNVGKIGIGANALQLFDQHKTLNINKQFIQNEWNEIKSNLINFIKENLQEVSLSNLIDYYPIIQYKLKTQFIEENPEETVMNLYQQQPTLGLGGKIKAILEANIEDIKNNVKSIADIKKKITDYNNYKILKNNKAYLEQKIIKLNEEKQNYKILLDTEEFDYLPSKIQIIELQRKIPDNLIILINSSSDEQIFQNIIQLQRVNNQHQELKDYIQYLKTYLCKKKNQEFNEANKDMNEINLKITVIQKNINDINIDIDKDIPLGPNSQFKIYLLQKIDQLEQEVNNEHNEQIRNLMLVKLNSLVKTISDYFISQKDYNGIQNIHILFSKYIYKSNFSCINKDNGKIYKDKTAEKKAKLEFIEKFETDESKINIHIQDLKNILNTTLLFDTKNINEQQDIRARVIKELQAYDIINMNQFFKPILPKLLIQIQDQEEKLQLNQRGIINMPLNLIKETYLDWYWKETLKMEVEKFANNQHNPEIANKIEILIKYLSENGHVNFINQVFADQIEKNLEVVNFNQRIEYNLNLIKLENNFNAINQFSNFIFFLQKHPKNLNQRLYLNNNYEDLLSKSNKINSELNIINKKIEEKVLQIDCIKNFDIAFKNQCDIIDKKNQELKKKYNEAQILKQREIEKLQLEIHQLQEKQQSCQNKLHTCYLNLQEAINKLPNYDNHAFDKNLNDNISHLYQWKKSLKNNSLEEHNEAMKELENLREQMENFNQLDNKKIPIEKFKKQKQREIVLHKINIISKNPLIKGLSSEDQTIKHQANVKLQKIKNNEDQKLIEMQELIRENKYNPQEEIKKNCYERNIQEFWQWKNNLVLKMYNDNKEENQNNLKAKDEEERNEQDSIEQLKLRIKESDQIKRLEQQSESEGNLEGKYKLKQQIKIHTDNLTIIEKHLLGNFKKTLKIDDKEKKIDINHPSHDLKFIKSQLDFLKLQKLRQIKKIQKQILDNHRELVIHENLKDINITIVQDSDQSREDQIQEQIREKIKDINIDAIINEIAIDCNEILETNRQIYTLEHKILTTQIDQFHHIKAQGGIQPQQDQLLDLKIALCEKNLRLLHIKDQLDQTSSIVDEFQIYQSEKALLDNEIADIIQNTIQKKLRDHNADPNEQAKLQKELDLEQNKLPSINLLNNADEIMKLTFLNFMRTVEKMYEFADSKIKWDRLADEPIKQNQPANPNANQNEIQQANLDLYKKKQIEDNKANYEQGNALFQATENLLNDTIKLFLFNVALSGKFYDKDNIDLSSNLLVNLFIKNMAPIAKQYALSYQGSFSELQAFIAIVPGYKVNSYFHFYNALLGPNISILDEMAQKEKINTHAELANYHLILKNLLGFGYHFVKKDDAEIINNYNAQEELQKNPVAMDGRNQKFDLYSEINSDIADKMNIFLNSNKNRFWEELEDYNEKQQEVNTKIQNVATQYLNNVAKESLDFGASAINSMSLFLDLMTNYELQVFLKLIGKGVDPHDIMVSIIRSVMSAENLTLSDQIFIFTKALQHFTGDFAQTIVWIIENVLPFNTKFKNALWYDMFYFLRTAALCSNGSYILLQTNDRYKEACSPLYITQCIFLAYLIFKSFSVPIDNMMKFVKDFVIISGYKDSLLSDDSIKVNLSALGLASITKRE